ncbi:NACHT-domain-containing protein [Setomelanomma holmii]|uniref:NACHT-domain-containing protein n=1 Tax=Setomelanomma holmii TaxID=210430 RepID=A0A9P4GW61_9PLEO|nr:NACHT-domain-containing protein [Setomelanomma holmii]
MGLRLTPPGALYQASFLSQEYNEKAAASARNILTHHMVLLGADSEEVTFADLVKGDGKDKPGYQKIRFCGEQAQQNGLRYFWAIRSMFCWYQNATICYAYLTDVSTRKRKASSMLSESTWEPAFRSSRWFTRGWTLQELLALNTLDVNERLRWKGDRETNREEDAYEGAARRLKDEIDKLETCVQDIRHTDPRDDKKRIEDMKGGLLADSYRWVLNNTAYQQWQKDLNNRLLWVKGDPSKGKTMLLCGLINELQSSMPRTALLLYFFCQATDARINSGTAVLQGLLYMLITQQPLLASHVRKKHNYASKALFEDANAWVVLADIFGDVLQDPRLRPTYLIIDALDECVTNDLPKLLEFVAKQSSASSCVKWIVSSRNLPGIEEQLEQAGHKVKLSLELNAESVSQLAQQKKYDKQTQDAVFAGLTSRADGTFLWVALVCQDLGYTKKRNALKKLDSFPPGLDPLYERMMQQISVLDDAELCKQILALEALVYQPITLEELVALAEPLRDTADEDLWEIINLCGSFLTLREDLVYFVHQSAKDFLLKKAYREIFCSGANEVHRVIFTRSLAILSSTLHRDMYSLKEPGLPIKSISLPDPDPLAATRYPCVYWIDHLHDSKPNFFSSTNCNMQVRDLVDEFLRKKYLYWLEGLSLCKSLEKGVVSMARLWSLVQV